METSIIVCTGIGLNMFFPEYLKIEISKDQNDDQEIDKIDTLEKNKEKNKKNV